MKRKSLSLAALAAFALAGSAGAAIVVANGNGNFESTTISNLTSFGSGLYQGSSNSLDGWTFSGGSNSTFRWLFGTDASSFGPVEGSYSLNIHQADGNFANVATTTVSGLTVGQSYDLVFDTAVRTGGSGTVTVKVDGSSVGTFDQTVGTSYVTKSFAFTPTSATVSVAFEYASTVNNNGYMLDNVNVIPEPSAALIGGLGMLALLRRRRA